jgi:GT2 family glycosyltransferase
MQDYSAVVVAPDNARQLLGGLLALRAHARPREVLLVDNASTADLSGAIRLAQLPVRLLRLPEPRSPGAAFNAGLDIAAGDHVLLLRGDVLLEGDPRAAVALLERHADIGVVGAKLLEDGPAPRRVLHAGYDVGRGRLHPAVIGWRGQDHFHDPVDVAAMSDACMVVRRTEVRFDERLGARLADVDLCFQYGQRGYRVVFLPALQAAQRVGGAKVPADDLAWAARQLAAQFLYHERWCSELALEAHPRQVAVRGEAALAFLRQAEAAYRAPGPDSGFAGTTTPVPRGD